MHLHGHLEAVDAGDITFSDGLPERLASVEPAFAQRPGKAIAAYTAAAGNDAPEQVPLEADDRPSTEPAQANLPDSDITSVLKATGCKLNFQFVDLPLVDEWGYAKHSLGVTEIPGLFVAGLPWLTRHCSSIVGGVGLDAEYLAGRVAAA
ncbi:hypothetical protein IRJ34_05640 [Paenarthrobacter sp. GOM3]|uniref:hypothetical protein n=1 Tax=Paenarthrobacter sp. GOM3 TaxID=2782567 RepID=UPI0020137556|nr:hypothetical protein [Paenarthrobacter sp. GOM3]WOH19806.1 hypothetical protein IRJ34_05640 [Paenarthrobacter sp. GOM3]